MSQLIFLSILGMYSTVYFTVAQYPVQIWDMDVHAAHLRMCIAARSNWELSEDFPCTARVPSLRTLNWYRARSRNAVCKSCCQLLKASFFFWKCCFDRFMTKGSDFDMRLINGTKYKVNSMRLTNNMRLTARCA